MTQKNLLISGALMLCLTNSYASEKLNPIVVGATIKPIDIHSSPASLEIFTSNNIRQEGFSDISDLLNSISSVSISSNGGVGQTTSVFTRGTESNHTKFLLNGVELNPGTLGLAPIQNIAINTIDRVEIIKGSSSSLYGANAIGGVINIITKNDTNSVSLSSGSWSTNEGTLLKSFTIEDTDIQLSVNRNESKSIPAKVTSNKRHSHNSENLMLNIRKNMDNYKLMSNIFSSRGNTQYDSFGSNLNQDHDDYFYMLGITNYINSDILDIKYTKSQNKITQSAPSATDFTKTLRDKYEISYMNNKSVNVSKFGFTYTKEHMSELSYGTRYIADPIIKELFVQNDYSNASSFINFGARFINHSQFGDFTSGNFGISLLDNEDVYSFNINKSLRAPDATDLYGYGGNPNLQPEEAVSYELGVKRLINNHSLVFASYFQTNLKNLIEFDSSSVQYVAKSKITGIETGYKINKYRFKYHLSYTYMVPRDISNNQYLSKRSKHKINTGFIYEIDNNESLSLKLIGESGRKASPFSTIELGSYFILNASYNIQVNNNILNISIKNLLDKSYRNSHNYNVSDRSVFLTYNYLY